MVSKHKKAMNLEAPKTINIVGTALGCFMIRSLYLFNLWKTSVYSWIWDEAVNCLWRNMSRASLPPPRTMNTCFRDQDGAWGRSQVIVCIVLYQLIKVNKRTLHCLDFVRVFPHQLKRGLIVARHKNTKIPRQATQAILKITSLQLITIQF